MVLRTGRQDVIELDLFPMKPGEMRPSCPRCVLYGHVRPCSKADTNTLAGGQPSAEILFPIGNGIQVTNDNKWFNRKAHTVTLQASATSRTSLRGAMHDFEFAAVTPEDFVAWRTFFATQAVRDLLFGSSVLVEEPHMRGSLLL